MGAIAPEGKRVMDVRSTETCLNQGVGHSLTGPEKRG
jgi:hypothetical protein